jgi:hypothetical protein
MRSTTTTYNLITLIFLVLAVLTCLIASAWVSGTLAVPKFLQPPTDIPLPELQVRVSFTPSNTPLPTSTPFPTNTPTVTPTHTPTVTKTSTPTATVPTNTPVTPTHTQTATPSSTYTPTFTPTQTATVTWTPSATGVTPSPTNTPAPFPFEVFDRIRVRPDLAEACDFQGVAGNVFDLFNEPLDGIRIVVTGTGLPQGGIASVSGSNQNYGPGGWEVRVTGPGVSGSFAIQLYSAEGAPLSEPINFSFSGSCSTNLVLISYKQVRPF